MNLPPIVADVDLTTLIYMIAVVLWVIGNVFSKSKKGNKRPPVARSEQSSAEQELREFLETLSGRPGTETPEEVVVKPQPKPVKIRQRARLETTPPPPPRPQVIREPIEPQLAEAMAVPPPREVAPISSFSKTLTSRGSQWKMPGLSMTALRYALSTNRPVPINPLVDARTLRNKNELRRIIGGKIILGPPRAFDPYDGVGDYKSTM